MSPDGEAIVTGAGDETLRFWNVFSKTRSTKVKKHFFGNSLLYLQTSPNNLQLHEINYVSFSFVLGICISFKSLHQDTITLSKY